MSASTTETSKSNRSTKLWLILFMVLSVLLFVFGYVQKLEADKQKALATVYLEEARKSEKESIIMAEVARREAKVQQAMAEEQRLLAEQALENCKKNKR